MGAVGVVARRLCLHVVNFERENRQAVKCPCRAFGVDGGVGQRAHVGKFRAEECVEFLHHVRAVLIGFVYAAFYSQCFHRVDVGVADYVFKMPLDGVNVVFCP